MNRRVVLVYITALIVGFSYGMHNPIVPVFSKEVVGASYFDLGIIGFSNYVPYMFIPLFVGLLLDRFNNGILLSLGLALDAASVYLLSIANSVPEVIIFRTLTGVAHSFFWPPCESIISQASSPETRVKSISRFMAFFVIGLMMGPLVGSFLLQNLDVTYRVLFQFAAFALATSIISALLLTKNGKTNQHTKFSISSSKQIMKFPVVMIILLFCSAAFGIFLTILPAYMSDKSISESNIELLFFIFGISRLVSLLPSDFLMKKFLPSLISVILSIAVGMLVVFYSHSITEFVIAVLILGFGFSVYFPLTFEIIMRRTRKEDVGGLIGAYEATFGIGWAAGPLIAGIMANSIGTSTPYLLLFIMGLAVAAISVSKKKTITI
ncbi:MAG: MFS transporter [Thaumarchaeota archaeon 13_1_40CM_38_12]|nr:MAG: MFS transporter [Thaumarchaeota archaeon 13_1_40CM_38_12]OLC34086.1 MAG: MFS transporter [Thaumarchaeota archaeon 13_1_40CM_4_38_7]OLC93206.1 MAG: MFS transporter [Thaumarchaeota archaeon 13_1_40CM_3_38_6]OLD41707.1 MAG: MFS transporter [Thaumarchaeota archaeon 13_1_40CM_2_39_4]TLY03222.1 MAG: MFS transporter [Nitrososphaerota archaeon]